MRLVVEQGELAGQTVPLDRPSIVIGRGKDSDVVLLEADVSRQHARLQRGAQGWTVVDLGTTNGTFVNGKRLPAQEPYLLRTGDRITVGSSVLAVQDEAAAGSPAPQRGPQGRAVHPAILLAGAVAFVLLLVGIIALTVVLLEPRDAPATPTAIDQGEQLQTVLPVPTEMQDIISTVIPALPGFFGVTPTPPPPGAAVPEPPGESLEAGS